jgi:hypothetical protein
MPGLSPEQVKELMKLLEETLEQLWNSMPPDVRQELMDLYISLRQSITALGNTDPSQLTPALIALLERIQAFLARLVGVWDNFIARARLSWLIGRIEAYLKGHLAATSGAGEEGATAGGTLAEIGLSGVLAILLEIIVLLIGLHYWYEYWAKDAKTAPRPYGGRPCGKSHLPVATGLRRSDISYGTVRSWNHLMEKCRTAAASYPCSGSCTSGTCKGVPAIQDFDQTRLVFAVYSWATFDVYCECV